MDRGRMPWKLVVFFAATLVIITEAVQGLNRDILDFESFNFEFTQKHHTL
jgi:hypothetical protein